MLQYPIQRHFGGEESFTQTATTSHRPFGGEPVEHLSQDVQSLNEGVTVAVEPSMDIQEICYGPDLLNLDVSPLCSLCTTVIASLLAAREPFA